MKNKKLLISTSIAVSLAVLGIGTALSVQDRYSVKVPNGLGIADFRGYETWQVISVSLDGPLLAVVLGNPQMIDAYRKGIPANGKPVPDGAKMAKIHWNVKKMETFPAATVPSTLHDLDFMVKDSKRFADSGGWGYGQFDYDDKSDTFSPATSASTPPQGNDARCGFACHTIVKTRDYVFTEFPKR